MHAKTRARTFAAVVSLETGTTAPSGAQTSRMWRDIELGILNVELRLHQLEDDFGAMRARLVKHRNRTGTPAGGLEAALAEFGAEVAELRHGLVEISDRSVGLRLPDAHKVALLGPVQECPG